MLNFIKKALVVCTMLISTANASVIGAPQIALGEYEDEFFGGGFYTVNNQTDQAITQFGVTTAIADSAWIDDLYYLFADDAKIAFSEDDFDYYLGDAWSASFYDESSWNANFSVSHGSYTSLFGAEENTLGVNWFYFDEIKFSDLFLSDNAQHENFFINPGEVVGDSYGSYFRFGNELASNFVAFNSQNQEIDRGSANEFSEVPEPNTLVLLSLAFVGLFGSRKFIK